MGEIVSCSYAFLMCPPGSANVEIRARIADQMPIESGQAVTRGITIGKSLPHRMDDAGGFFIYAKPVGNPMQFKGRESPLP